MNNPLIFYGAGLYARNNLEHLISFGLIPVCFADADKDKHYKHIGGNGSNYEILPLAEAVKRFPDYLIYISCNPKYLQSICASLVNSGIPIERIINFKKEEVSYNCIMCESKNTVCHDAQFEQFLIERMFNNKNVVTKLVHCLDCNFWFSLYRPSDEEMDKLYLNYRDNDYQEQRMKYDHYYTKEFNANLFNFDFTKYRETESFLEQFINFNDINNVLDYGGDRGQYIPKKAKNRYVYDISKVTPESGVKSLEFGELHNYHWDLVINSAVLEHVNNPKQLLNDFINLLPASSYLLLEVPIENISKRFSFTGEYVPYIHEHINYFRIETIIAFIQKMKNCKIINISSLLERQKLKRTGLERLLIYKAENKFDENSFNHSEMELLMNEKYSLQTQITAMAEENDFIREKYDTEKTTFFVIKK